MLSFRDTTFCFSFACKNKCGRKLTKEVREAARKWWSHDPENAPIAVAEFCDNEGNVK